MSNIVNIKILRLKEKDQSFYKQLFSTWYMPLCNYACSVLRDMDEAEDVVQKMFCKLWEQRETIVIRTSVKSYLYRAVHNDCLNRVRQIKIHAEHKQHYTYTVPQTVRSTADRVVILELEDRIVKAIDLLPPKCKRVFEMSRMQQLSYVEIANELNISTNTVENHMAKALKLLRNNLKEFLPLLFIFLLFKKGL